eukprot:3903039-Prymnesium_polylepis.1
MPRSGPTRWRSITTSTIASRTTTWQTRARTFRVLPPPPTRTEQPPSGGLVRSQFQSASAGCQESGASSSYSRCFRPLFLRVPACSEQRRCLVYAPLGNTSSCVKMRASVPLTCVRARRQPQPDCLSCTVLQVAITAEHAGRISECHEVASVCAVFGSPVPTRLPGRRVALLQMGLCGVRCGPLWAHRALRWTGFSLGVWSALAVSENECGLHGLSTVRGYTHDTC